MPPQNPETARWLAEHVQPHEPRLRAWPHSWFPQLTDADDVVQESSARLITARGKREVRLPQGFFFATARAGEERVVALGEFVVAEARETNATALAINEQRFAGNIKSVASGDAYGEIGEGNVGAFRKFVPGVTIDLAGFQPNIVSVRGVPANNPPLTVDGNPIASTATSGPDKVANTADDVVGRYDREGTSCSGQHRAWGLERRRWQSTAKLWALYQQHPDYFVLNDTSAISMSANTSRKITETISAGYLRADARLFQNRLWPVGGARYEHTEGDGHGVLNDLRATYQRDAQGNLILVNGRPVRVSADAVALARLHYNDRGAHSNRHYADWYPRFNATCNLREDLIARLAYAKTLGWPYFVPISTGTTVSDPTAATRTITVNNPSLAPWTADNWDVTLECYPNKGGLFPVGAFRKDVTDFVGNATTVATAEELDKYGLSDACVGDNLVSPCNVGDVRVTGVENAWRQRLEFLANRARGVGVFLKGTERPLSGATAADFSGSTDRTINWGASVDRPRFSTKVNGNYTDPRRRTAVIGANVPAGTDTYLKSRLQIDVNVEWRFSRRLGADATVRNLTNRLNGTEAAAPNTPASARTGQIDPFSAADTSGRRGSF